MYNIFLNDLLTVLTKPKLDNFADDNTISVAPKSTNNLLMTSKNESELAVKWFRENNVIVKFQAMV